MENRNRILISLMIIAMTAALIGGGTMAWFTAKAELGNEFTAGTVMIEADEEATDTEGWDNVNPGDCFEKDINIENTGTKGIHLRLMLEEEWDFDWEYIRDNWEALCFTEKDEEGWNENWDEDSWEDEDFRDYVRGLENPVDLTDIDLEGWTYNDEDGYYYYDGSVDSGASIGVAFNVCFDGPTMNNFYQAADYTLNVRIEAIQTTNYAPYHEWEVDTFGVPED